MSELESGFKIYRANEIPPEPAPVLVVEVRAASHQFFVQYFLWGGDASGTIQKFQYPRFPGFQLDIDFGFNEAVRRVEGQLNNQLFEALGSTDSRPRCTCVLYSFEEVGPPELYRLQLREDGAYAALRNNAMCPPLLDLLEAGGALERLRQMKDAGLL